jgi:ATP-dependent protease ClpP protease subunit
MSRLFPYVVAQISPLDRAVDIYDRLLRERIIFLGTKVDDSTANLVCGQLLVLATEDAAGDIRLYINSPGGSIDAGLAIYDVATTWPGRLDGPVLAVRGDAGEAFRPASWHDPDAAAVRPDAGAAG